MKYSFRIQGSEIGNRGLDALELRKITAVLFGSETKVPKFGPLALSLLKFEKAVLFLFGKQGSEIRTFDFLSAAIVEEVTLYYSETS